MESQPLLLFKQELGRFRMPGTEYQWSRYELILLPSSRLWTFVINATLPNHHTTIELCGKALGRLQVKQLCHPFLRIRPGTLWSRYRYSSLPRMIKADGLSVLHSLTLTRSLINEMGFF